MVLLQRATGFNTGDIIATAITLGILIFVIVVVLLVISKLVRKRGNGNSALEQERTLQLQKQVEDLNARLTKVEKLLREVE